ncbi:hypothetical protein [Halomicrobium katesii]|uniref:hypothetical protein n=1 Tax=Halomicrobium katesii TaxID=437163 RepID=UPI001B7FD236|nr:hypothetical protein [Halomicrobium katesii]
MPDGVVTSGYNDNPGYLIGWIGLSVVPVIDIPADLRDAAQNTGQGDYGDAALDAVSLAPFLASDAPKAIKISTKWVKVNPGKSDEAYAALRKSGLTKNLKLDDRVKIASAFKQYDAAIIRISEDVGKKRAGTKLAKRLDKPTAKRLATYEGPYATDIKRSVVGFYAEGSGGDDFVRYMTIAKVKTFTSDLKYLEKTQINYRGAAQSFASQTKYRSPSAWNPAKGALLETRIGAKLSKNGEEVSAIGKATKLPRWSKLSEAKKQRVIENSPDGASKEDIAGALNGGQLELDVIANGRYIEAKNKPSGLEPDKIRTKFIRYRAAQALRKAPEGDMVIRVSKKADENNAIPPKLKKYVENTEGIRIGDPVSVTG